MEAPISNYGRPEGTRVIAINNEPLPGPLVATLVRFDPLGRAGTFAPVIRTEDGREFLTLGMLLPYSEELWTMVQAIPGPLAYKTLCRVKWFQNDINRHEAWLLAESQEAKPPETKLVNAGFDHPGFRVFQEVPLSRWDRICRWFLSPVSGNNRGDKF